MSAKASISRIPVKCMLRWNTVCIPCRVLSKLASSDLSPEPTCNKQDVKQRWRIVAATCVQRMPTLGREKTPLELEYEQMKDQLWLERSKLSDFELEEAEQERIKKARIKKALEDDVIDNKSIGGETDEFDDLQESRVMELQEFEPASRVTEADRTSDVRSLERKLDRVLYLLVKKPRQDHAWQMPQGGVEEEESLIEAAKRELTEECGTEVRVTFYSNTPQAVLSYKHTSSGDSPPSVVGSKVFFLKAIYNGGVLQLDSKELVDYVWVTKEEMSGYVSPDYYKAIEPILTE